MVSEYNRYVSQSLVNEGRFPLKQQGDFVLAKKYKSQSLVNEGRFPQIEKTRRLKNEKLKSRNPSLMRAGFHKKDRLTGSL
mgnify:CR=1 FL=1